MAVRYFTLFFLSGTSASVKENTKKGLSELFSMGQRLISRWPLASLLLFEPTATLGVPQVFAAGGEDDEEGGEGGGGLGLWRVGHRRVQLRSDHGGQVLLDGLKVKKDAKKLPSNCRPAGLPAKSSEEELRHQRQYQKLVEEARRKEQEDNRCDHCNCM